MNEEQKKRLEETRLSNRKLETRLAKPKGKAPPVSRAHRGYREQAARLNPNPAVTVYDSRGRAKKKSDNHQWVSKHAPTVQAE